MGRGRPSSSEDFLLSAGDRSRADGVLCDWVLAGAQSGPSVLAGAPSYLYFAPRIRLEFLAEDPAVGYGHRRALGVRRRFVEMALVFGQALREGNPGR